MKRRVLATAQCNEQSLDTAGFAADQLTKARSYLGDPTPENVLHRHANDANLVLCRFIYAYYSGLEMAPLIAAYGPALRECLLNQPQLYRGLADGKLPVDAWLQMDGQLQYELDCGWRQFLRETVQARALTDYWSIPL